MGRNVPNIDYTWGGGEQVVFQQVTTHISITISKSPFNFERVQI